MMASRRGKRGLLILEKLKTPDIISSARRRRRGGNRCKMAIVRKRKKMRGESIPATCET